jgi:hypothetical protein
MAARITSNTLSFSDGTTMNSIYNIIPLNSVSVFYQAVQPLGWTKSSSHNQKALRVVSSGGGFSGGSLSFPSVFKNYNVSGTATINGTANPSTLTSAQLGPHLHGMGGVAVVISGGGGDVGGGGGYQTPTIATTTNSGGDGSHSHPFSGTVPYNYNFNLTVKYVDVIICTFTKTT